MGEDDAARAGFLQLYHDLTGDGGIHYEEQLIHHVITLNTNKILFVTGDKGKVIVSAMITYPQPLLNKIAKASLELLLANAPWILCKESSVPPILGSIARADGAKRARDSAWALLDMVLKRQHDGYAPFISRRILHEWAYVWNKNMGYNDSNSKVCRNLNQM